MLECLIIGDSIGVGLSKQMTECHSLAIGGYNTYQWNKKFYDQNIDKDLVIISLGSNDHKYVKTKKELETIRSKIKKGKVIWILPNSNLKASEVDIKTIQAYIKEIAKEHNDLVIGIKYPSQDRIHPSARGYEDLARESRKSFK